MTAARLARALALFVVLLALAPDTAAAPTPEERVLAETLFLEGKRLMSAEKWNEACAKLEESYRLEPLAGVLLNLALCHEKQGRTATAWSEFKQALALAKIDRRKDREQLAREHIEKLEPQLARLRIVVPEQAAFESLIVQRGDVVLPRAAWGAAIPIDPGRHTVRATAPGYEPVEVEVEGIAGEVATVELAPLEPENTPAPDPPPPPVAAEPSRPVAPTPPATSPGPRMERTAWPATGWSLVGVGSATMVVGASFGIRAIARENRANNQCAERACPTREALGLSNEAQKSAVISNVALVAGGVLAASGGLVLWLAPAEVAVSPSRVSVRLEW